MAEVFVKTFVGVKKRKPKKAKPAVRKPRKGKR